MTASDGFFCRDGEGEGEGKGDGEGAAKLGEGVEVELLLVDFNPKMEGGEVKLGEGLVGVSAKGVICSIDGRRGGGMGIRVR